IRASRVPLVSVSQRWLSFNARKKFARGWSVTRHALDAVTRPRPPAAGRGGLASREALPDPGEGHP
ncbi:MAG TPA: hypothetical protein VFP34_11985, partial [Microlunatus sp.]|nr:hypothetical protein [Microlunatus sp.]